MLASAASQPLSTSSFDASLSKPLVIGIVAGEASGDSLGADFMAQMNNLYDNVVWVGVGGPKMKAQGLQSLFPLERLAVMGLVEVLSQLPDLLKARKELVQAFAHANIDWFIGIDAPDFNLRVAKKLKPKGIFCVQYVSPSIWAWRESRIESIKQATHLVLCLFPFELEVYQRHNHPAICVGHPLLHNLPRELVEISTLEQRRELVWNNSELHSFFAERKEDISLMICLMPGSRRSEINAILPLMLDAVARLLMVDEHLCFVIPTVDKNHQYIVQDLIDRQDESLRAAVAVAYDESQTKADFSQSIMAMCDMIVLASGTATLEAMLLNRPMVVVYQMKKLTYAIASRLVKVPYVSLPNILAGEQIVPELIQDQATGDSICRAVTRLMRTRVYDEQLNRLAQTTAWLKQQSSQTPVSAVINTWHDYQNQRLNGQPLS
ncbi:lipid-A-disaccharide synthase [Psychrobacter sp. YP14]|uniref:Lipid-A-disaccharide synthase n=2 Tax=Psychrobacter TaxID=497 RepID=A0A844LYU4_9GAMM|nr:MULTISPECIES: lipid-A-disaccharide synthase [Psychrobacter]AWT48895.1 lipid-A-disaccharide synthase [Psychrobacter sp. YP14]MUG31881.1 lipid-A-disaccharide synthase [Psychrobacter sanguinis]